MADDPFAQQFDLSRPVPGQPGNYYTATGGVFQVGAPAITAAWQQNQISGVSQSFATPADAAAAYVPLAAPPPDHPNGAAHDGQETNSQTLIRQATGVDTREPKVKPLPQPDVIFGPVMPGPSVLPVDTKPNLWIPAAAIAALWFFL